MADATTVSNNGERCIVCNAFKLFIEFNNKRRSKDGYHSQCKECRKLNEQQSVQREENRHPIILVNGEPTICEELLLPELKA